MARLRVCTTVERPRREVWRYLARVDRHAEWMRDCVAIRFETARHKGRGARFVAVTRVAGITLHDRMEITRWWPGRRMAVRHLGPVGGTGEFRLARAGRRATRFCWEERLRFPWWLGGALGAAVALPVLRTVWRGSLRDLKARLEAG